MKDIKQQAAELGIPTTVAITDDIRYDICDARTATLTSIEGNVALYFGECLYGHTYQIRKEIQELQQPHQILNGEIVSGTNVGYQADALEDF